MTNNSLETIRRCLHFINSEKHLPQDHVEHDRLFKKRPIINCLDEKFGTVPMNQRLAIEEQMFATKVAHFMKQYLSNKRHKWGFKLFFMYSVKDYAHKFEINTGEAHKRQNDEPGVGPVGNIVVRLSRWVHRYLTIFGTFTILIRQFCWLSI